MITSALSSTYSPDRLSGAFKSSSKVPLLSMGAALIYQLPGYQSESPIYTSPAISPPHDNLHIRAGFVNWSRGGHGNQVKIYGYSILFAAVTLRRKSWEVMLNYLLNSKLSLTT